MDETGAYYTEQSKSERNTPIQHINTYIWNLEGFPGRSEVKTSSWNAGDPGSIPELGRSPGEENGNSLQYSCLENPMDGGAW